MNWYRRFKFAQMMGLFHGEFWIDDSGTAMSADGDTDNMGHEAYVIDMILSKYGLGYESDNVDVGSSEGLEDYVRNNFEECVEALVSTGEWSEEDGEMAVIQPRDYAPSGQEWMDEAINDISLSSLLSYNGASEDEINMVCHNGDARLFAMKNWGWKRLEGLRVETWLLTPKDMKTISYGLYDAYGEEIPSEDENGDDLEIGVFVHSNQSFTHMTYADLESGSVQQKIDPITPATQDAYQNAVNEIDRPSNSYYKDWN